MIEQTRRLTVVALAASIVLTGCGDDDSTTTTQPPTPTTTTAPTTTVAPTTTSSDDATTTTIPTTTTTTTTIEATTWGVVLVAPDDVLNARDEPLGNILFTLGPADAGITTTGSTETLDDGDVWRQIEVGGQTGWVNARFITEAQIPFGQDDVDELIDGLSSWALDGTGPEWGTLVSPKGFHVIHFDAMKTWAPSQNPFLDQTVYDWGGEATGPGQPVASNTFTDQVGAGFAGVVGDQDLQTAVNQPLQGTEAAPAFIPVQFQNFDYIAFLDPGDDPANDGLDWETWYVYFDWTGSGWTVVGMSVDGWAP